MRLLVSRPCRRRSICDTQMLSPYRHKLLLKPSTNAAEMHTAVTAAAWARRHCLQKGAYISVHALENFASSDDGSHDGAQAGLGQHDVSSTASSFGRTCTTPLSSIIQDEPAGKYPEQIVAAQKWQGPCEKGTRERPAGARHNRAYLAILSQQQYTEAAQPFCSPMHRCCSTQGASQLAQ